MNLKCQLSNVALLYGYLFSSRTTGDKHQKSFEELSKGDRGLADSLIQIVLSPAVQLILSRMGCADYYPSLEGLTQKTV